MALTPDAVAGLVDEEEELPTTEVAEPEDTEVEDSDVEAEAEAESVDEDAAGEEE